MLICEAHSLARLLQAKVRQHGVSATGQTRLAFDHATRGIVQRIGGVTAGVADCWRLQDASVLRLTSPYAIRAASCQCYARRT